MKLDLIVLVTLSVVLSCICEVICLPNVQASRENETDSSVKGNNTSETTPFSVLWKFNASDDDYRVIQAKLLRSYMNFSIDPCRNFYEYACGNWEHVHPIPKDRYYNSVHQIMNENVPYELREILLQPVLPNQEELGAVDKVRVYYATCVDEDTANRRGTEPLLQFVDNLGGWPVLDKNWSEERFDWLQLAIKTSLLSYPRILFAKVRPDYNYNPLSNTIYLEEANFFHSKDIRHMDAYSNLIVTVLKLLDVDPKKAENTAKEIIDFENQLASITAYVNTTSEVYIPTTIEALSKDYPTIDWMTYLSAVLETPLQPNQSVVMLTTENYYSNLSRILKEVESSTLANHMVWQSIYPFLNVLDKNFRTALQTFKEVLNKEDDPLPRWMKCLQEVNENVGLVNGALLAQRFYDEGVRNETNELLFDLRKAFGETLLELDWIDNKTKELVQQKLQQTDISIYYPDLILNTTELNKFYSDVQVAPGKRFENSVNLRKFSSQVVRKSLRDPVEKSLAFQINNFKQGRQSFIGIPLGFLQPPLYHKHSIRSLFYGTRGVYMAYELAHGLYNYRREFDDDAIKEYKKREECFTGETRMKRKSIADNVGIRQAFRVYRERLNENRKDDPDSSETLPGLNLTNDQLFFLGFAQTLCNAISQEDVEKEFIADAYSTGSLRVIGTLANFDTFSKAFQCPTGSNMNPKKKCELL